MRPTARTRGQREQMRVASVAPPTFRQGREMSKRLFFAGCLTAAVCLLAIVLASTGLHASAAKADAPHSWGFDTGNLDKTCKPCDDFYEFAMGGWMKSNPIPPEYPSWGTFTILADRNQASMRGILEASMKANPPAGSNQQKIRDFYASCMDTAAIDASGIKPIAADLSAIDKI